MSAFTNARGLAGPSTTYCQLYSGCPCDMLGTHAEGRDASNRGLAQKLCTQACVRVAGEYSQFGTHTHFDASCPLHTSLTCKAIYLGLHGSLEPQLDLHLRLASESGFLRWGLGLQRGIDVHLPVSRQIQ